MRLIRFLLIIWLWAFFCAIALHDAGAPYQCTTDTQCELLHGRDE